MTAVPEYQPEPTAVESALTFLTATTDDLSGSVPTFLDTAADDAAVRLLSDLRQRRQRLAELESYVETDVARRLDKGKHTVAGWLVEVRGGGAWKDWRHDDVAFAACRDIAVDPATGEIVPEVVQIIDQVRSRLLNCARPSWRLTQLANFGIDPGDYARYERGRKTVTLTEAVDE